MVSKWHLKNLDSDQNYANPGSTFWNRKCRQHLEDEPMAQILIWRNLLGLILKKLDLQ